MLDDFHRLSSAVGARQRRVVRRPPAGERRSSCSPPASTRRCRSAPCAPTGELLELRADDLRFTVDGGRRVPQRPARHSSSSRPTSSCWSRAPRAGRPASTWRRCRWPGSADKHALVARVRRHERPRRRLPLRARCSPPSTRSCRRSCCARRCSSGCARPLCDAVLGEPVVRRRARVARAHEPVPAAARRPAASGFASTTCSPSSCASSSSGASRRSSPALHRRAYEWHVELGTTDEAIHHAVAAGAFARGRAADRRDLGALRQRRPDVVGARLAAALPGRAGRRRPPAAARPGVGVGAARRRGRDARARWRACASSAASTTARCPTASRRSSPASRC